MSEQPKVPFYRKTWFSVLTLIIFFPIGLIIMWMFAGWKKSTKGIVTGVLAFFFIIGSFSDTEETNESVASENESIEELTEEQAEESTEVETEEETTEEVAEENTEKETEEETESERLARVMPEKIENGEYEVSEEDEDNTTQEEPTEEQTEEPTVESAEDKSTGDDEIKHEVIEGVDVFTFTDESVISFNNQLNNFSIEMTTLLSEQHEEIENDAVFRTISTVIDKSGNEKTIYSAQTYYTQETISSINFESWPQLVGEDLYNTADSVMIYHPLSSDTDVENKPYDNVPDFYRYAIGGEYKE